ncbi:MAG: S8 family serine peptidase [Chitinophagaceae bacterium]|nr:S8 family serine peptidase [Chitinophagaceae bacterium]
MKPNPISLLAAVLLLPLISLAQVPVSQKLLLRTGTIEPVPNISQDKLDAQHNRSSKLEGKRFAILQFDKIPTESEKITLKENGIELLEYVPDNAYTVTISDRPDADLLNRFHARALVELSPSQKIQSQLKDQLYGTAEVQVSFPGSYSFTDVKRMLVQKNFSITDESKKEYRVLSLSIPLSRLEELASLPFIEYVEKAPPPASILKTGWTQTGRDAIKASALTLPVSQGGKGLKGLGVVVGVGDDSDPSQHPDFSGRVITRTWQGWDYHGTHVAGIIGGAGLINEVRRGAAPGATIVAQTLEEILTWAPTYVTDYNMVLTNNSYGNIANDCYMFGRYSLTSRTMDQMSINYPHLEHVFASGNSGQVSCPPIGPGYRTVFGDYQVAKNVLTVGNTTATGDIFIASSRGPALDGRIKPEICAIGTSVTSTTFPWVWNYYADNTGTSMACPAITGGMALLYEKYRDLHANADPDNVLVKALVVNSGDDYGNPGPDYIYGYGQANFWRAEEMLENDHYAVNTINAGDPDQTIPITIPAGTAALKVMICWNDPAAAAVSYQTLVNDLDLRVEPPSGPAALPFILDTTIAGFANTATTGADHINNLEQVVIANPTAGATYNVKIKANNITQGGSQKYALVYDLVPNEIRLMSPLRSEAFVHGDTVIVQWDCYDEPANTFKLEFAADGSNFNVINATIPANKRQYYLTGPDQYWVVPSGISTDQAKMRISKNGTSLSYTSGAFVIHDTILVSLSADQCPGYISIDWNAVPGASGYEVMMIRGTEMSSVATVSNTTFNYTIGGLSADSVYWVTVRPLIGSSPGRRAFAVSRQPNTGSCTNAIYDNDLAMDTLVAPVTEGRINTSTAFTASQSISVRLKNLDNAVTAGVVDVGYILNGGSPVIETITPNVAANSTYIHNFSSPVDLSAVGTYVFKFFAKQALDPNAVNDTIQVILRQLSNPSITGIDYPSALLDNFDAAPEQTFKVKKTGLTGLDRYDFSSNSIYGRIRSFFNTGEAHSGNRALTMDVHTSFVPLTTDSITGTFNLASYSAATDDIRLDFYFRPHTDQLYPNSKVFVRGSDTDPWIKVYDLSANLPALGTYKFSESIEIADSLAAYGQNFSTSTQLRWAGSTAYQASNLGGSGYTFDDIQIYRVQDDIKMVRIDTPYAYACGLNSTVPVKITIRNTSNQALAGPIPVKYRINGGTWVQENTGAGLSANNSLQYSFVQPANLSAPGNYLLEAVVKYGTDSYAFNDTARITIKNQPLFTVTDAAPYLQDFESGDGSWYTVDPKSNWEYGSPASYKIDRAASGTKAWKTRLQGTYDDGKISYLYSPCFDISTVTSPALSFSIALDLEDCGGGFCDGAYLEYSADGNSWARLGATGQGTNWYNRAYTGNNVWSVQNYQRWHVATIPLSVIPISQAQLTSLRFRFVIKSDASVNRDGVAFDDFHIYSNATPIYVTTGDSPVVNLANVTGNNWVKFVDGGKIIAAINPNNATMGSTDVQSYIFTGPPRSSSNQFYLKRNITIKPGTRSLSDSATVRFYFTDAEAEALIAATGCACAKPATVYQLGVTKYTDPVFTNENGTLADNSGGAYSFIVNSKTKLVPYDVGYYAEFKVKDFSEFWLSNGGLSGTQPLPLTLLSFSAQKRPNRSDVLVSWRTTDEYNLSHFEIEVSKGNSNYQQNRFSTLARVNSSGGLGLEKEYSFTDLEPGKSGVYYYRLKMVDIDGQFRYSSIKPVVFDTDLTWQLYPNPAGNISYLTLQVAEGTLLQVRMFDQTGKTIKQFSKAGTGFLQKIPIELQGIPAGLYTIEVGQGTQKQYFRLLRQ